ncbi:DNRLRE domain-containing protein [Nanoarchaeota archaeon]
MKQKNKKGNSMINLSKIITVNIILFCLISSAFASTETTYASEGASVLSAHENTNYGNANFYDVGKYDDGTWTTAYTKFPTDDIGQNKIIDEVDCNFYAIGSTIAYSLSFSLATVEGSWSENTITWNNRPDYGGPYTDSKSINTGTNLYGWQIFDCTEIFQQAYDEDEDMSVVFYSSPTGDPNYVQFYSDEGMRTPYITIKYSDAPCSDGTEQGDCSNINIGTYCDDNLDLVWQCSDCGCASGYECSGEICLKSAGQSCNSASECADPYCVNNICSSTPYIIGDGVCDSGEDCSNSVDCGCGDNVCDNGQCVICINGDTQPCPYQEGDCSGSVETCTNNIWPGCNDCIDSDGDNDPDYSDCAPSNSQIYHGAPEIDDCEDTNCINDAPSIQSISGSTSIIEGETASFNVNVQDYDDCSFTYSINNDNFLKDNNDFIWETRNGDQGTYDLTFTVSDSEDETDELISLTVLENPNNYVNVYFDSTNVLINEEFEVPIIINTSIEIYSFDLNIHLDPNIIEIIDVDEGDFLDSDDVSTFGLDDVEESEGTIQFARTRISVDYGINGTGSLIVLTLRGKSLGTSDLNFDSIELTEIIDGNPDYVNGIDYLDSSITINEDQDPCDGISCNPYCDGTTRYYAGQCNSGECEYQTEPESETCGYVPPDPCDDITCNPFCEGTTRYYNGNCNEGACEYQSEPDSEQCGYIPPNPCDDITCNPYCHGTTRYYNGNCNAGDCEYQIELKSEECGYIPPDPCEGITCNPYCDGTTRYYDGNCNGGECEYETEPDSEACGYVPPDSCDDITCNPYCEGTTRYYNGECTGGECEYQSELESEECGYVPPDPCDGITCDPYCDGTTQYYNGNCNGGECEYETETESEQCGYIPPCIPITETCDGIDNDCDGQIDEGVTNTCTNYDTCNSYQTCGSCESAPEEICDLMDNNCNGLYDEGLEVECYSDDECPDHESVYLQPICQFDGNCKSFCDFANYRAPLLGCNHDGICEPDFNENSWNCISDCYTSMNTWGDGSCDPDESENSPDCGGQ